MAACWLTPAVLDAVAAAGAVIVHLAVPFPLPVTRLALARVRVAVGAAERIRVRLLIALVAPACAARVLARRAEADALVRALSTRTALVADALVRLRAASAAYALCAEAELAGATAVVAVPAVRRCRTTHALADKLVAVVAGHVLTGHAANGLGLSRSRRCRTGGRHIG